MGPWLCAFSKAGSTDPLLLKRDISSAAQHKRAWERRGHPCLTCQDPASSAPMFREPANSQVTRLNIPTGSLLSARVLPPSSAFLQGSL